MEDLQLRADTEEPGVYETSDVESDPEIPSVAQTSNEDIIETEIEYETSHGKFENQFVNGKINFDYQSHMSLYQGGYKVSVSETQKQKLGRLSKELYALRDEMEEKDHESDLKLKELLALAEELKGTPNSIKNPYREEMSRLFEKAAPEVEPVVSEKKDIVTPNELIELDKKINKLETKLGNIDLPLDNTLNELTRKINIINNPEYEVEEIKASVNTLFENLNYQKLLRLSHEVLDFNADSSVLDTFKVEKINELLSYLPELNNLDRQNKLLLNRLKMLNRIHLSLDSSIDFLNNLETLITDISTNITNWNRQLSQINEKLDSNIDQFGKNKIVIEKWVNELSEKVDKLN